MKRARSILSWSVVAITGGFVGWAAEKLPTELNSVILTTLGTVGTLASGYAWAILRRIDELKSMPGLDTEREEMLSRKIESRRRPMWHRWTLSIACGMLTIASGQYLKTPGGMKISAPLLSVGYSTAFLLILAAFLLMWEYQTLSRLGADLKRELKQLSAKRDMLQKVRA